MSKCLECDGTGITTVGESECYCPMCRLEGSIGPVIVKLHKLEVALRDILACTPHVIDGQIVYDCGDPYDIARQAIG